MEYLLNEIWDDILKCKQCGIVVSKIFVTREIYSDLYDYLIQQDFMYFHVDCAEATLWGYEIAITNHELERGWILGVSNDISLPRP